MELRYRLVNALYFHECFLLGKDELFHGRCSAINEHDSGIIDNVVPRDA